MTQGCPLSVVAYAIGVLLLIKLKKSVYPGVNHTWYVDNTGALGTYDKIELYFNFLNKSGLGCGQYPKPPKIVLIVHLHNIASRKDFGLRHGFKVCTGMCYLGGLSKMTSRTVIVQKIVR